MSNIDAEIERAEAQRKAAADRLKALRAKQRAEARKAADAAALKLGRDLLAAADPATATAVFKAWRSHAFPDRGERSETEVGTAHLDGAAKPCQTNALLAADVPAEGGAS